MRSKLYLFIAAIAAILSSGIARADDPVSFAAATDGTYRCISSCVGFTTSDPAHTVEYVNLPAGSVVISIDGKVYTGQALSDANGFSATALADDGTYALVSVQYWTKRTCTTSGRAQHCTVWRFATAGTFTL